MIDRARDWLIARQKPDGHWCAELEGDTTLESYIVLLKTFLGHRADPEIAGLGRVIRGEVLPDGGWSAYRGGPPDLSVSCLSYFALKLVGDAPDSPHMARSRKLILSLGGAERANTYTRYHFALFGQYPWARVPAIPPEMIFLPSLSPFSIADMSAWSRTIFVPLSVVYAHKPVVPLPPDAEVQEIFVDPHRLEENRGTSAWDRFFYGADWLLKRLENLPGAHRLRERALRKAIAWTTARMTNSDGLGAILPAMTTSVLALKCVGTPVSDPIYKAGLAALDGLLVREGDEVRVQPCHSPVWDTSLVAYALSHAGLGLNDAVLSRAATWLLDRQCRAPGDWAVRNPAPPGGWCFEYRNEPYPDVDDTAMALMVLERARAAGAEPAQADAMARGLRWMLGMQNDDGGWASFDRNNDKEWLTHVPFADHNAMIDPSTADITGRVLECLGQLGGYDAKSPLVTRAIGFLKKQQELDGAWFGRWGVNYIYGTGHVLRGLAAIGEEMNAPYVQRAARWLEEHQNSDGGWGESIASYDDPKARGRGVSTPSQTAWALIGLLAAGHRESPAVRRGVRHLIDRQNADGTWEEATWTGTGFPRVFYLNYGFYRHHFPLIALAQYRAGVAAAGG